MFNNEYGEAVTDEILRHEADEAGKIRRALLAMVASLATAMLVLVAVTLFWSVSEI